MGKRGQARSKHEAESLQHTAVDVGGTASSTRVQQALAAASPAAPAPAASNSRKRKSEASSDEAVAAYKQKLDHIDVDDTGIDLDCNQVRSLIRKVIERGIFKKGEFCTAIGCSPTAVNRFLEKTGPDGGFDSDVYECAWAFFKKRELAGLSMPAASALQKKAKTTATRPSGADPNSVHLDGEETDSVPVFETCDVVRRKITAHLKKPGVTQAQFCRDLYAQLKMPGCKSIQSKMLSDFRAKKGPTAGCTGSVYYAAYVYFEKLRIAEGKPKSKHRLDMEDIHPLGADRENDGRHG
ncbi:hypothetical protein UCDDA912_g03337 [Diaporthe ampelina]|uniref:DUF7726 domain-containing protein n=1 Tax=Diaporthe ampelina TaxID=1214573 RepID=A0A0G2IA97_9PEZI|nr:hypothetical protein UCDDA912_g03337 [Diaporthe ampelina]